MTRVTVLTLKCYIEERNRKSTNKMSNVMTIFTLSLYEISYRREIHPWYSQIHKKIEYSYDLFMNKTTDSQLRFLIYNNGKQITVYCFF